MSEIQILDSTSNAIVARDVDRQYPGVLIQGDTLRTILDDLDELRAELETKNIESAKEVSDALRGQFVDLLTHYECVLERHGFALPYVNPVKA